ncbi:ATP-grasp domain-containing protein [Thiomicrorhabdus heinhorstiae]|uniref:ATP-grasp domain-containing protein n=1 Tax=Thiomicrorhabdus heinhorstiae TaxID=2748010 RepID=A0ABS0BU12_9GAMM|nr:ATP-grasp domain-containing protein [Thiomicrorhabdus heinhorstiae]MBF6057327.1 ATP-grasp domain-containing protein [Thiomicrorhabdus heinhorstiae]
MNRKVGIWMYQNGGGDVIEQKMIAKFKERGIECVTGLDLRFAEVHNGAMMCKGTNMLELDLFFSYNAGEQTGGQVYMYEILNDFVTTVNSFDAFKLSEDKLRTNMRLHSKGIPTTEFFICHRESDLEHIYDRIERWGKMVFKPVDGWGGAGMALLNNRENFDMLLPFVHQMHLRNIYVEKFINYDFSDYRIDIVDGQFVGCYGRKASGRDWRTNVTAGGKVILREPNDEVVNLAIQASKAMGMDIAGVDILYDLDKETYTVLEINGIPAFATPDQEEMGLNFNDKKIDLIVDMIDRKSQGKTA